MGVPNIHAAQLGMVPGGAEERRRGKGPVPVIDDVDAMLAHLAHEHAWILRGGSCCIVVCQPDENDRIPRAVAVKESAERFAHVLRGYDANFLYEGDKLLLCLPQILPFDAAGVMSRLRKLACEKPVILASGERVTMSVTLSGAMMSRFNLVEDTLAQAEWAMKSSLSAGGNRVCMLMTEA